MSAGFEEGHAELIRQLLTLLRLNHLLVVEICLVADQYALNILPPIGVLLELPHPVAHVVKALFARAVISKDRALCIFEVVGCDVSVSLLPGCVPYLQLHIFAIELQILYLKVNPYR